MNEIPEDYRIILKILWDFLNQETSDGMFHDYEIDRIVQRGINAAVFWPALDWFTEHGILIEDSTYSSDRKNESYSYNFSHNGYDILQATLVPASDRFVPLDHNSQEATAAKNALEKLEERIRISNELTASQSERLAMMSEVQGVRQLLDQPVIRVASIWTATKNSSILAWLATHAADATITALATEIIGHLFKISGFS